jgi:hypothetical protein
MQSELSPVFNCHTVLQTRSFERALSVTRPFDKRRLEG